MVTENGTYLFTHSYTSLYTAATELGLVCFTPKKFRGDSICIIYAN